MQHPLAIGTFITSIHGEVDPQNPSRFTGPNAVGNVVAATHPPSDADPDTCRWTYEVDFMGIAVDIGELALADLECYRVLDIADGTVNSAVSKEWRDALGPDVRALPLTSAVGIDCMRVIRAADALIALLVDNKAGPFLIRTAAAAQCEVFYFG